MVSRTSWQAAPPPYPVIGDEDALAQILVNLLSNAEKYSGERKEVEMHSYTRGRLGLRERARSRLRRAGAARKRKIFEAFYRAHDSLSSGIQGSGLGLTLAQRLAQEHGGEIIYQAREGGGSNFTLRAVRARTERRARAIRERTLQLLDRCSNDLLRSDREREHRGSVSAECRNQQPGGVRSPDLRTSR